MMRKKRQSAPDKGEVATATSKCNLFAKLWLELQMLIQLFLYQIPVTK